MTFLINAFKIIFLLGVLVFIHEGGHFLAARFFKVKVEEFSIGFGPKLFTKKGKETTYSIGLIPFGGYVKMLGEEERSEEEGSFNKAKVFDRIIIVAAGAIVNIKRTKATNLAIKNDLKVLKGVWGKLFQKVFPTNIYITSSIQLLFLRLQR